MAHRARRKGMSAKAMRGEGNQRELRFTQTSSRYTIAIHRPVNVIALHA
jgi:hypothetical protein